MYHDLHKMAVYRLNDLNLLPVKFVVNDSTDITVEVNHNAGGYYLFKFLIYKPIKKYELCVEELGDVDVVLPEEKGSVVTAFLEAELGCKFD